MAEKEPAFIAPFYAPYVGTHGHVSRVGSGASAAGGASAKPTYVHRKLIGTIMMGLMVTATFTLSNDAVYNGSSDNVADDPNPNSYGANDNRFGNTPNANVVANVPNPSHVGNEHLATLNDHNFHNPPVANHEPPDANPELTRTDVEKKKEKSNTSIIPYLSSAGESSYYHGSKRATERVVHGDALPELFWRQATFSEQSHMLYPRRAVQAAEGKKIRLRRTRSATRW